jgi:hypothetical protein
LLPKILGAIFMSCSNCIYYGWYSSDRIYIFNCNSQFNIINEQITAEIRKIYGMNIFANGKVNGIYFSYLCGELNLNYESQISTINYGVKGIEYT